MDVMLVEPRRLGLLIFALALAAGLIGVAFLVLGSVMWGVIAVVILILRLAAMEIPRS